MAQAISSEAPPASRALRIVQLAALALSAALAIAAATRILAVPAVWNDQPRAWARVALLAAALVVSFVLVRPRHAAAVAGFAVAAVALCLLGIGPVAVVTLMFVTAVVTGASLMSRAGRPSIPASIAALVGFALTIGIFELTLRLRVHFAAVHVLIGVALLALWRHRLRTSFQRAWATASQPSALSVTERAWIAIAGVVAIIHIVVAAKPEVGYDASTLHLQFAQLVASEHAFRHGIDRYLWAVMPLGADYLFASAYLMGGEPAARTLNLALGALACALLYRIARTHATRETALACTTLFASMPLASLVTGSLFSETLLIALLLGALATALEAARGDARYLAAFAVIAGGALATKVMSLFWLAPMAAVLLVLAHRRRMLTALRAADVAFIAAGVAIGTWPYAVAWITTGNPVFPFMNSVFRSPHFETVVSFNNPLYNAALRPWTPWEIVLESSRFTEGRDGALGLAWLLALPLVVLHFLRRRSPAQWLIAALAVAFFVAVYTQQSYLRYLLPSFALVAVLSAFALSDLARSAPARVVLLGLGVAFVAFDVRNIAAAHYVNATPCAACLFDARARQAYVETYAPLRAVSARLNRELPDARVGFLLPNEEAPAGYVGASRSANWHDDGFFRAVVRAPTAAALLEATRHHGLTHIVYRATRNDAFPVLYDFALRHATPLWRIGDYIVGELRPVEPG